MAYMELWHHPIRQQPYRRLRRAHPPRQYGRRYRCLPGSAFGADGASVSASRVAFDRLFLRIEMVVASGEPITLTTQLSVQHMLRGEKQVVAKTVVNAIEAIT
jgi:hypothetical protein